MYLQLLYSAIPSISDIAKWTVSTHRIYTIGITTFAIIFFQQAQLRPLAKLRKGLGDREVERIEEKSLAIWTHNLRVYHLI